MKTLSSILASAMALTAAGQLQAAPANDSSSASTELLAGPAVTGSNIGATLESGELIPAGYTAETYAGSVWWHWTPVMSGWFEITTEGSSVDTVLSVWEVNDDAKTLVHASAGRVQLQADSNKTYKIAVAGRGAAAQGALSLRAFYIPAPFAKVLSAKFEQTAVDVTTGSAGTKATLTIEASRELGEGGVFSVISPAGLAVASVPFSAENRVSGFVAHGEYEVSFSLPQYISEGGYTWNLSLVSSKEIGQSASQGLGALTPAASGTGTLLTVVNNGVVDGYAQWVAAQGGGDLAGLVGGKGSLEGNLSLGTYAFGGEGDGAVVVNNGSLEKTGLPSISAVSGSNGKKHLRVQYSKRKNAALQGLSYKVQFSDDLTNWVDSSSPGLTLASNSSFDAVAVDDTVATDEAARRFARVLVERTVP